MQRVLITGATSAIAAAMARMLAEQGARLYLLGGRSREKLDSLVADLEQRRPGCVVEARTTAFDQPDANEAAITAAITALGGLDLAVIAQGLLGDQVATEASFAEAEQVLTTNLMGVVSILIPLGNHFERAGGGHIAVFSSVAAERGRPRNYTYAAAKGALN
ncbi:MAG TPA: SDR family NAD(P)-dependent oxidoreductase, partial [Polyangia bacterium]